MNHLDDPGRPEPALAADEKATLVGFLEYQRATLAWKCAGLDTAYGMDYGLHRYRQFQDDADGMPGSSGSPGGGS